MPKIFSIPGEDDDDTDIVEHSLDDATQLLMSGSADTRVLSSHGEDVRPTLSATAPLSLQEASPIKSTTDNQPSNLSVENEAGPSSMKHSASAQLWKWIDHLAKIDGLSTRTENHILPEVLRRASMPAAWTLQVASGVWDSFGASSTSFLSGVRQRFKSEEYQRQNEIKNMSDKLQRAETYEEWYEAASRLDVLEENDKWKKDPKSSDYDYQMMSKRLIQLRQARESGNIDSMIFLLRTSLSRNLGDMGNPKLYSRTYVGTKKLIDEYIDEVVTQLNLIADRKSAELDAQIEFFVNTRQFFGRTALLLSGGATLGLNHVGVIKALHERKLLPRIISGSSAGSLVAALVCSKTDDELISLIRDNRLNLNALEAPDEEGSLFFKVSRFIKHGVVFDVKVMQECVRSNIGDITFQEAYNRTRRILNITVSSSTQYEMPRLLNYLTAPNVLIWSAVAASCAIPFIYKGAPLMARDKQGNIVPWNPSGHRWIDGSVENDLPMLRLSEMFNVNHFIVCQVNPHVAPFLPKHDVPTFGYQLLSKSFFLVKSEVRHRLHQLSELGIFPTTLHHMQNILSQKYDGDITIIPDVRLKDYRQLIQNPSRESLIDAIIRGERATWPRISIIRNHCQIELKLDEILYRLRCRKLDLTLPPNLGDSAARPLSMAPSVFPRDLTQSMMALDSDPVEWNPEAGLGRSKSYVRPRTRDRNGTEAGSVSALTSPRRTRSANRFDEEYQNEDDHDTSPSKMYADSIKHIKNHLKMTPLSSESGKSSSQ